MDRYASFERLTFERPAEHVLRVTLNSPQRLNAIDRRMHGELERVWSAIDDDPEVRCTILTGAGRAFCAGGAADVLADAPPPDPTQKFAHDFRSASRLAFNMIEARKPIVSAINGQAVGAGLALALLADVPIAAREAKLLDGHTRMGLVAGDHAALIWPLLCGIANAKFYLMTNRVLTGAEAERKNLVALAVPSDELAATAVQVAAEIAQTAPTAVRMTKYVINHWLRQARPIFDLSLAMELAGMSGAEPHEAMAAFAQKRPPRFEGESEF
jgi:enoyl-CoA hydratase